MSDAQSSIDISRELSWPKLAHSCSAIFLLLGMVVTVILVISFVTTPLVDSYNELQTRHEKISNLQTALQDQQTILAKQLETIGANQEDLAEITTSSWATNSLLADADAIEAILSEQGFTLTPDASSPKETPLTELVSTYRITVTARGDNQVAAKFLGYPDMPQSFLASASLTRDDTPKEMPILLTLTLSRIGAKSESVEGTQD